MAFGGYVVPSRLTEVDLARLRRTHGRLAGPPPAGPSRALAASRCVEMDRLVNGIGGVILLNQLILVGSPLAGHVLSVTRMSNERYRDGPHPANAATKWRSVTQSPRAHSVSGHGTQNRDRRGLDRLQSPRYLSDKKLTRVGAGYGLPGDPPMSCVPSSGG
jgi:hypothetical protein